MDVVAIEGCDESGMQQLHGLMCDAVGRVLGVLDELDAGRSILLDLVVAQDVLRALRTVHDEFRVTIEQD